MAKRKSDARFLKSEKLLISAVTAEIRGSKNVTITDICRRAGVFESTFYRHYRGLNDMIKSCENKILKDFSQLIAIATKENLPIEQLFRKWAFFIYRNRDMLCLSIAANQLNLLMIMIKNLWPIATVGWRSSPQKMQQIYLIYSYEIAGVWLEWAEQEHFATEKIPTHIQELSYLTRTALQRLGGITN